MTALKVGVAPGADAESFFGMDLVGRIATTAADAAIGGAGSAARRFFVRGNRVGAFRMIRRGGAGYGKRVCPCLAVF
jgi:hypothetical protein